MWYVALVAVASTLARNAPGVSDDVRREAYEDVQLHDVFSALEDVDKENAKKINGDRNMVALLQTGPDISDEVRKQAAESIQIHDVFKTMTTKK